jgi:hypothetical protein
MAMMASLAKKSYIQAFRIRPFAVLFVNGLGGTALAPAAMFVDLVGFGDFEIVLKVRAATGRLAAGTTTVHMESPEFLRNGVPFALEGEEVGVSTGLQLLEGRVNEVGPKE